MKLHGIFKGDEYVPASLHNYRIVEERGRFLLESVKIAIGIGRVFSPVGFVEDGWEGLYSFDNV